MIGRRLLWPVVGSIALVVLMVAVVFPTHTYLTQREELLAEETKIRVLDEENRRLAARVAELRTDAEIERLAREQYNLVRPGEEAYAILPGPGDLPEAPTPAEPPPPPARPWWDEAWDAVTFWD